MELKAGYKQTEIGLIPQDWEALPASQIGRFRGGAGFPLSHQGSREGDFPFYKVSDMNNDGNEIFMATSSNWISEDVRRKIAARVFPAGSIVFAKVGAAIFLERKKILSRPSCIDNNMAAFVINDEHASVRFFHSQLLAKNLGDLVATTALPSLSGKVLGEMVLAVPSIPEQSAIATVLSDVDALLAAQDALIAKKRAIKQGAMHELLTGKRRLLGFSGGWVSQRLGVAAVLKARIGWQGLTTAEYLDSGDYYLVTGTDFLAGKIDWANCAYVDKSRYDQDPYIQVVPRDVLVTKDGTIGKIALVDTVDKPGTLNSGVFVIRPKNNSFVPEFFYYLLQSEVFETFLTQLSAGSTINHLYQKDFVGFAYQLPPTAEEQVAIAEVLRDMDIEIAYLESKRSKWALLKQGMMQALLTGQIRLV